MMKILDTIFFDIIKDMPFPLPKQAMPLEVTKFQPSWVDYLFLFPMHVLRLSLLTIALNSTLNVLQIIQQVCSYMFLYCCVCIHTLNSFACL